MLKMLLPRIISEQRGMARSMAIYNNLDKGLLAKYQIPAGVQIVLSKHCLFLSSLCLQYELCIAFQAIQETLFFIYMRKTIRCLWWQVSSRVVEITYQAARLEYPPAVSFPIVHDRGCKCMSCSMLSTAGLPRAVAHTRQTVLIPEMLQLVGLGASCPVLGVKNNWPVWPE